jgi:hypothetical protein
VAQVAAEEATVNARRIVKMREEHRQFLLRRLGRPSGKRLHLPERLPFPPMASLQAILETAGLSFANPTGLTRQPETLGLPRETAGQRRNRRFCYTSYFDSAQLSA